MNLGRGRPARSRANAARPSTPASPASTSTCPLSPPGGTTRYVRRRKAEIFLAGAVRCARPDGEDSSMFSTLPGAPFPDPADGQTVTSPRPARPSMPMESRSRAKAHSTSLPRPAAGV
jgi:hypothetical protein